jgi:hypothetical protein
MSANQVAVVLSVLWLIWVVALCRRLRVSWIPPVPILFLLGLGGAILLNRLYSPAGTIVLSLALVLPLVSTIQLLRKPKQKQ